ncbi:MAG: hypothetical protein A2075_23325 [Geobacteraceae bacterium GWC2_58_44]|nr:MAG: hypothetical protein A2075_23325 [Geobacteraceae bacterium GWC2_58_44]
MAEAKLYLTVKQVPGRYPAFTENAIRWLIFNRDRNEFSAVIRKVGKKVLIDEAAFVEWIEKGAKAA